MDVIFVGKVRNIRYEINFRSAPW